MTKLTKSASHTPEPWIIVVEEEKKAHSEDQTYFFYRFAKYPEAGDRNEAQANARLIAASPMLLEACKAMVTYIGKHAMEDYGNSVHRQMLDAIAKAEEKPQDD